ncbi:MAG: LTA synthase family protein [Rikenellaceae bacterium]
MLRYIDIAANHTLLERFQIFVYGLNLDITVAGYITTLPLLLIIASVWLPLSERIYRAIFMTYYTVIYIVVATIMAGDLGLYEYWGFRVDSSVLFYLRTPEEAMASVTFGDVAQAATAFGVMCTVMIWGYCELSKRISLPQMKLWQKGVSTLGMLLCAGVMFIGIRGGLSSSVANLSKAYFSNEPFLNHAAVNPQFSLLSTLGKEDDFVDKYQFFTTQQLSENLEMIATPKGGTTEMLLTTERPNILFIIGESFSESILNHSEEGVAVMPHLRQIASSGVNFTNAIANSFRTDRGVTSALYGFPAQPRTSIMKYPSKSRKLPSLAAKLSDVGYTTEFLYGGDLNFTDMASMLYSTGWQNLWWQQNLKIKGAKQSDWGYDDSIMARYTAQRVEELDKSNVPFIATWLTLSSHEPFDVPYDKFEDRMLNAMAFSDEAVGDLIESLRGSDAWENLLVIIVADHAYSSFPRGIKYNSLQRHRIPLMWCGGAVEQSREVELYISQMDIVATLLAQMNIGSEEFEFSRNVLDSNFSPRGYYAFSDGFGVVDAQGAIIFDNNSGQIISAEGEGSQLEMAGKTILQRTMEVIASY